VKQAQPAACRGSWKFTPKPLSCRVPPPQVRARQLSACVFVYTRRLQAKGLATWVVHSRRKRWARQALEAAAARRWAGSQPEGGRPRWNTCLRLRQPQRDRS
jgi:hypothetical protein